MNIISSSDNYVGLNAGHFLSRTGGCKTWDISADGYCRGEAVASVIIKPLSAAQADNHNILGVILSAATNYSAQADSITRPHGPSQEGLYRSVLRDAGIQAADVDYIEMHGTGTQIGDTVEMSSVSNVFAPLTPTRRADDPLHIGAVKANIGHGESASGVTGLIKSLLVLREQSLPPHIGIKTVINPKLPDMEKRNIHIPTTMTFLPSKIRDGSKRRVLNNFIAAGGNMACTIEEPPDRPSNHSQQDTRFHHVISISAKSFTSIIKNGEELLKYLERKPEVSLSNLSYTTTARRIQHPLRHNIVTTSLHHLRKQLSFFISNTSPMTLKKVTVSHIGFCFTDQGSLYRPLGKELFDTCQQFRSDLLRLELVSKAHGFEPYLPIINDSSSNSDSLSQIYLALVAIQIALARLFLSYGVVPSVIIGHSLGEYAALYASGVLSASDTLYLVGKRASLIEFSCSVMTHCMLAVQADGDILRRILGRGFHDLEIACVNGPRDLVLSGPLALSQEAEKRLKVQGLVCRMLKLPFAYHSAQMDPLLDALERIAASVDFKAPKIPLVSPVTGNVIYDSGVIGPSYIRRHTRQCVRFKDALLKCEEDNLIDTSSVWVEIGPHPICLEMIRATLGPRTRVLPSLHKKENPWEAISKSLSSLHTMSYDINWQKYHQEFEQAHRLLPLPRYAWDEKNYWLPYQNDWLLHKGPHVKRTQINQVVEGPQTTTVQTLVSRKIFDEQVSLVFESDITDAKLHPIIAGHIINGSGLCPAVRLSKSKAQNLN